MWFAGGFVSGLIIAFVVGVLQGAAEERRFNALLEDEDDGRHRGILSVEPQYDVIFTKKVSISPEDMEEWKPSPIDFVSNDDER